MSDPTRIAASELILGGQRSGKSHRAETLASHWLDASPAHRAVLIATAQPWDDEMRQRIARHQADHAQHVPGLQTVEVPTALAECLARLSRPDTLVVVDCLTLWLTNLVMPVTADDGQHGFASPSNLDLAPAPIDLFLRALAQPAGPVVLVSNEIGMGVIPLGAQVRAFVDALGRLNQNVARTCTRVTLMAAGLPLTLKDAA
jgi:adenosylcobinamide kinase/adenosylcobinamide-phosphate guanylyltransferase